MVGAAKIARDISERKRSERQTAALAQEAEHRARNILATVSATVQLSQGESAGDLKRAIQGRIRALANAHTLFARSRWAGAELHDLVTEELAPYCQSAEGRALVVKPGAGSAISRRMERYYDTTFGLSPRFFHVEAAALGIIDPILVGPQQKIAAAAAGIDADWSRFRIADAPHSHAAAEEAVRYVYA